MEHVNINILTWHLPANGGTIREQLCDMFVEIQCLYEWYSLNLIEMNVFFDKSPSLWSVLVLMTFWNIPMHLTQIFSALYVKICLFIAFCLQDLCEFIHWLLMSRMSSLSLRNIDPSIFQWIQLFRAFLWTLPGL